MPAELFPSWTIYNRPLDYPEGFIARRFTLESGVAMPTVATITGPTLEAVREQLHRQWPGMMVIERHPDDHETVVETWL